MYISGDIGGTKTWLALLDESGKKLKEQKFPSSSYSGLSEIVTEFLQGDVVAKGCFGVAGPVKDGVCKATNLPWVIESSKLPVQQAHLLNDLEANAWGIQSLPETAFQPLLLGDGNKKGHQVVVSAGTGLGEAGIFFDGTQYTPFPSEAGHADFAPRTKEEIALLEFLLSEYSHASYERILSGPGLVNIYTFFRSQGFAAALDVEKEQQIHKKPEHITKLGLLGKPGEICYEVLRVFATVYGAECGNAALRMMAYGGVFLGGGIAPKILPILQEKAFAEAFLSKGRLRSALEKMPVYVIKSEETALLGASFYVVNRMK